MDGTPGTAQAINGVIGPGDWVMAAPAPPYSYLVGRVTDIDSAEDRAGGVHVSFTEAYYPEERKAGILEAMNSALYRNEKTLDAFALDDVTLSPADLIRVTDVSRDKFAELLESGAAGEAYCGYLTRFMDGTKEAALMERLDKNLADYHAALEGFPPKELIGMADRIAATDRMHAFLTQEFGMDGGETDFLLLFQNPLEVVTDSWYGRSDGADGLMDAVIGACDTRDALAEYPLMRDANPFEDIADEGRRRFMGVDLTGFLGKIADKVIVHYPEDWKIDVDRLYRAADSDNPDDRRLMWHVSGYGTHINTERETFIRDTSAYNTWVDYRPNDPDMFGYAVEVTGRQGNTVTGNVFDLGHYHAHELHVRENALPLDMLSLAYTENWGVNAGKTITVPRFEYDSDRHRLMSGSGDVSHIIYHPYEGARKMSDVLRSERAARMAYPLGSMEAHLKRIDGILAEVRSPPEMPPADKKPSIGEKLKAGKEKAAANRARKPTNPAHHRKERGD